MLFEFCLHVIIPKVTGLSMAQSQCFFVLLNLDFSCDLSNKRNGNIFGSKRAIRKIQKVA